MTLQPLIELQTLDGALITLTSLDGVCVCLSVCVCLCVCVCVCVCVDMCVCVWICVCVSKWVCVCVHVHLRMFNKNS